MPRTFDITLPAGLTAQVLEHISPVEGVVAIRLQQGIGIRPSGDVITIEMTNRAMPQIMRILDQAGLSKGVISLKTTEPVSLVSLAMADPISLDTSESTWEEMDRMIAKESNMTLNSLVVMAVAGFLAAVGLEINALHIVVAAMLIAPGFEPIVRIPLAIIAGGRAWRFGLLHTLTGYLALMVGAAAGTLVMGSTGVWPSSTQGTYLSGGVLISFWTQFNLPTFAVSAVASAVGALLVVTNRSVLTAGVMVALALVPSAALVAMGLVTMQLDVVLAAIIRLLVEIAIVAVMSAGVFAAKRASGLRRRSGI